MARCHTQPTNWVDGCNYAATREHEGKWYCGYHDPLRGKRKYDPTKDAAVVEAVLRWAAISHPTIPVLYDVSDLADAVRDGRVKP